MYIVHSLIAPLPHRLDGLEPIVQTIREFDLLIGPLENWCTITSEKYDQLQPLALTVEVLQKQKEEVAEIRQEIDRQKEAVEKAQDVAEQFFNDTEVSLSASILIQTRTEHLYLL